MRLLLVAAFVLLAAAAAPAQSSSTSLQITVWPKGLDGQRKAWTLRCDPVGGTLPRKAEACRKLGGLKRAFAGIPKDEVCTMIYGGPARARVTGVFQGRRIWTTFKREDGCHIGRWQRHVFLFPVSLGEV